MAKNVVIKVQHRIGEAIARISRKGENVVLWASNRKAQNSKTEFAEAFPNQKSDLSVRCYRYEHGKD